MDGGGGGDDDDSMKRTRSLILEWCHDTESKGGYRAY